MPGLPLADEWQRQVRERREVTRRADAALRRDRGMNLPVEHIDKQLGEHRTHAAGPANEDVRAQQHHGAHGVLRERLPDTGSVAANEIELQLPGLLGGDPHVREFAESRVDAVHRFTSLDRRFDCLARLFHGLERLGIERHRRIAPGDGHDISDGERAAIQRHRGLGHWLKS